MRRTNAGAIATGHRPVLLQFRQLPTFELEATLLSEELQLLARARAYDRDALTEIHNTYYQPILRYVAQKVHDRQTAEDLTSDVFVRLLDALQDKHAPANTLRDWLYGVASRVVNDHYRKQYRAERYAETLKADAHEEGVARQIERGVDLHEALAELTPEQQDVLALRFGFGLRVREVAETIGKQEGAVKQLQVRALRALARNLGGQQS